MGEASTPAQIEWEWLEYKERFNDLFVKFSAAMARQAKNLDPPTREVPVDSTSKASVRSRVALMRGLPGMPVSKGQLAFANVPSPEDEP